jgi:hypothetical protein
MHDDRGGNLGVGRWMKRDRESQVILYKSNGNAKHGGKWSMCERIGKNK